MPSNVDMVCGGDDGLVSLSMIVHVLQYSVSESQVSWIQRCTEGA